MSAKIYDLSLVRQGAKAKSAPSLRELVDRVHQIATDNPDAICYSLHALERMKQRGKRMRDILETVKKGEGVSGPKLDEFGDYRIKLRRCVSGKRVHVVVAVREKDFSVVTVT